MDNTNIQPENNVAPANGEVGKLFRSALRGFHKQDVTDYIERMARDRRRDAERYSAHIRSLEEERAAAALDLAKMRTQAAELTSESYAARQAKEELERELTVMREANEKLEHDAADLTERLAAAEQSAAPDTVKELEQVRRESTAKDAEIERLTAALAAAEQEKDRLAHELEAARRRPAAPAPGPVSGGSAELMNRVRMKTPAASNEMAAMRSRIERARQCAREGISECHSLYNEMRRNIERLEEILRDLND